MLFRKKQNKDYQKNSVSRRSLYHTWRLWVLKSKQILILKRISVPGIIAGKQGLKLLVIPHRICWHGFIQLRLNSDSAQVQTLLAACPRFAMVRISDNGNKAKRLSSVNHTTKTIHHHHHHMFLTIKVHENFITGLNMLTLIVNSVLEVFCFGYELLILYHNL